MEHRNQDNVCKCGILEKTFQKISRKYCMQQLERLVDEALAEGFLYLARHDRNGKKQYKSDIKHD